MSSSSSSTRDSAPLNVEMLFEQDMDSSEEDPPMDEWSSLKIQVPEENAKRILFEQDLYTPGSGEICLKYIPMSASSVLQHPYFKYPGIKDPGIQNALFHPEPKTVYSDDGQELYMALCKEIGISPIRSFYRQLLEEVVNLKYYGIHPMGFRAIAVSLQHNRIVKVLDLTDNWISVDGCYHLGEMISMNNNLEELNLHGCRIGPEGAIRLFAKMHLNHKLRSINLAKNCLTDVGLEYLSHAIILGSSVTNLNLSFNDISGKGLLTLAESFETHNKLTHLDLSWNKILSPNAVLELCSILSENKHFEAINLSWNSLSGARIGLAIRKLMRTSNLRSIYLNNNKLSTNEVIQIAAGLSVAKHLNVLDLSYNPLTPNDALKLLLRLKDRRVKLQNLFLDNILVTTEFLEHKEEILSLKHRMNTVVTWGGIIPKFVPTEVDMREIVLNRAEALCKKPKKKLDIALVILEIDKLNKAPMGIKEFARALRNNGVNFDEDFIEEICNSFPGPSVGKAKTINMSDIVDYIQRKWPDRKLPPTPPESKILIVPQEIKKKNKRK